MKSYDCYIKLIDVPKNKTALVIELKSSFQILMTLSSEKKKKMKLLLENAGFHPISVQTMGPWCKEVTVVVDIFVSGLVSKSGDNLSHTLLKEFSW